MTKSELSNKCGHCEKVWFGETRAVNKLMKLHMRTHGFTKCVEVYTQTIEKYTKNNQEVNTGIPFDKFYQNMMDNRQNIITI